MREQVEEGLKAVVDEAGMDLAMKDDGTFTVDGTIGGYDMKGKGTYEVDDDKISTTMTHPTERSSTRKIRSKARSWTA